MKYLYEGKEVEANVIDSHMDYNSEGGLEIKLLNGETRNASAPMTTAYRPNPGDYYVESPDGDFLISKKDFEDKCAPEERDMSPISEEETEAA